ncbi:acyl-CoA thioester hydrolase, YbgC/YbaW family [Variovorax sp. PBS-H4]|uniref:acyl-CoA thioesterase n=1 Tax=Variovorax sp. PBS-H4 TaxID=434008 RepID=UPI0013177852|nr:thioesterase family protein [Variovorax sp. PBS-H4]VTU26021.1 acyl-CoA thioester hydrolase, YbgC/YbaW family [Variovorax sp. PBS-H4]
MIATEQVLSQLPLVIRRRVKWGDCDPAGVVYTVTFSEYVISAAELFYGALFDTTPQRAKREQGFGTPSRALSFEFHRSLRPDDEFDMTVTVADIHSRTYVLDVTGRTLQGEVVFVAKLTPVCVARDERRSIEIPHSFRQALQGYRDACAKADPTQETNS